MSFELTENTRPSETGKRATGIFLDVNLVLRQPWFGVLARTVLTFMFWSSGLAKLIDLEGGRAEMAMFGLEPAWLFNITTVFVLLFGSLLVIIDRYTWLGAGALAVFTILTIPIAHDFWTMQEPTRTMEFHVVMEHITVVGGLLVVAFASALQKRRPSHLWI